MDETEKFKNQVIANLRACLISSQGGISTTSLNNDYKQLLGEPIPFRKLGYNNLEALLKSIPDINIKTSNGVTLVEAKTTASSNHISKLVQHQRRSGKKRSKRRNVKGPLKPQGGKPLSLPPRLQQNPRSSRKQRTITGSGKSDPKEGKSSSGEKPPAQNSKKLPAPNTAPPLLPNPQTKPRNSSSSQVYYPSAASSSLSATFPYSSSNYHSNIPNFHSTPPENFNTHVQNPSYGVMQHPQPVAAHFPNYPPIPSTFQSPPNLFSSSSSNPIEVLEKQTREMYQQLLQLQTTNEFITLHPQRGTVSLQKQIPFKKKVTANNAVQRGHKMSDCEWLTVPSNVPENSNYFRLLSFIGERGWPEPKVSLLRRKGGNVTCIISLKGTKPGPLSDLNLTSEDFTTFPEEMKDELEALEKGTKKVYDTLVKRASLNYRVSTNSSLILQRLAKMVEEKTNGVWAFQIEKDYVGEFHERLPDTWIDLVKESEVLCAVDLGHAYVVKPSTSENIKNLFSSNIKKKLIIPNLRPPESDQWDVYISRVCSYSEVWIRVIGEDFSQQLENLTTDMELSYSFDINPSPTVVEVDNYYVVLIENSAFRVIVKKLYENEADVHFVDYGDDDNVPLSCIREMKDEYYKLHRQALLVNLNGLEYTSKFDFKEELMDTIIGKSFIAVIEERDPYSLVLYDTSDAAVSVDINKTLLEIINSETLYQPIDLQVNSVKEVKISHIDEQGKVFIKLARNNALSFLEDIFDAISKNEYTTVSIEKVDIIKKYLYKDVGKLYRIGLCVKNRNQKYVDTVFIDEGRRERILFSEVFDVPDLSEILNKIPNQAVNIYLKDIPPSKLTKNRVSKLKEIAPPNRSVISKVVEHKDIPVVELFVRNQVDQLLCSVNHTIELEDLLKNESQVNNIQQIENLRIADTKKTELPSNHKSATITGLAKTSLQLYEKDIFVWKGTNDIFAELLADLPLIGEEYFEIYVSEAANPTNFTVQPLKYVHQLNKLTQEMKKFYDNVKPMVVSALQYKVYAVKQSDDFWYRACVVKVLDESITVKLCDFGHLDVIQLKHLRPLHKKFMDLPFLGFNASLAGIKPKHHDWSVDDCLAIKQMIKGKKLISVIKEIRTSRDGNVLILDITDTSSSKVDINVSHQLVIDGRAVYL